MDVTVTTYAVYVALSVLLTVWVARTLHRNGRLFLVDVFGGREELAAVGESHAGRGVLLDQFWLHRPGSQARLFRHDHATSD